MGNCCSFKRDPDGPENSIWLQGDFVGRWVRYTGQQISQVLIRKYHPWWSSDDSYYVWSMKIFFVGVKNPICIDYRSEKNAENFSQKFQDEWNVFNAKPPSYQ